MITIVTITFNNHQELLDTIASIPKDERIEHIVINGGSNSDTNDYLSQHFSKYISEKDKGISDAFNKGLKMSQGDGVIFINSGDRLLDANYLYFANELFQANSKIDFIYSSILIDHVKLGQYEYGPSTQHGDMPFPHPSMIVRSEVLKEIGPFNLEYKVAMDFDLAYRLKKYKKEGMYYDKGPVVLMEGGGVSSNNGLLGLKERIKILKDVGMFNLDAKKYLYTLMFKQILKDKIFSWK